LLGSTARLHPAITKKQKPWDLVELIWLEFLQTFTTYPEGQSSVAKISDVLDLVMTLTSTSKGPNKTTALMVLRNIAFYQPNRSRLLTSGQYDCLLDDAQTHFHFAVAVSGEFLNLLKNKLDSGNREEKSHDRSDDVVSCCKQSKG
jgi:hypothetical protein